MSGSKTLGKAELQSDGLGYPTAEEVSKQWNVEGAALILLTALNTFREDRNYLKRELVIKRGAE